MAVLVEGISIIIRAEAIVERFPGGWEALEADPPNATLCADGELVRVGFMASPDVKAYGLWLEKIGIRYVVNGKATDLVVADQRTGFAAQCDWAEFGRVHYNGNPEKIVTICRAVGSKNNEIVTPIGWAYEDSLTAKHGFVSSDLKIEFLNAEGNVSGVEVYTEIETGKRVFIGRTQPPCI